MRILDSRGIIIQLIPLAVLDQPGNLEANERPFDVPKLLEVADLDKDGNQEILVSDGKKILVLESSGKHLFTILP